MTDLEWLLCRDVMAMLDYLFPPTDSHKGLAQAFRPSERKLLLFAIACCLEFDDEQGGPISVQALRDLRQLVELPPDARSRAALRDLRSRGVQVVAMACSESALGAVGTIMSWLHGNARSRCSPLLPNLLREVTGGPDHWESRTLRPGTPLVLDASALRMRKARPGERPSAYVAGGISSEADYPVLPAAAEGYLGQKPHWKVDPVACSSHQAVCLAQAAYDSGVAPYFHLDDNLLGALADLLEREGLALRVPRTRQEVLRERGDAVMGGCCDRFADQQGCNCLFEAVAEGVLEHLRSPGPHVRGCWALDDVLGRA